MTVVALLVVGLTCIPCQPRPVYRQPVHSPYGLITVEKAELELPISSCPYCGEAGRSEAVRVDGIALSDQCLKASDVEKGIFTWGNCGK